MTIIKTNVLLHFEWKICKGNGLQKWVFYKKLRSGWNYTEPQKKRYIVNI